MVKLQHQPYESWLLSGEALNPEQVRALQAHLGGCNACRNLAEAWKDVQGLLAAAQPVKPAPGFSSRWQTRLAHQRSLELARKQHRQSLWMLILWLGGAFIVLGALIDVILTISSPAQLALNVFLEIAGIFKLFDLSKDLFITLLSTFFHFTPPLLWFAGIAGLGLLSLLWVISLRQIVETWRIRL